MSIISKPHGDFVPITDAEAAKVNDQFNTIYADHNGGLLDANIATGANIQQSKVLNLAPNLATINTNISTLFTAVGRTVSSVVNDAGEPSSAFVGEADIYSPMFVAANSLGATNYLTVSQDFLLNILTNSTCQLRYYYGGILCFNPSISNATGATQSLVAVHVEVTIKARNSATSQMVMGRLFLQSTDDLLFTTATGARHFLNATGIAADSTLDASIQSTVIWDQPGNLIVGVGCSSWIVK